MEDNNPPQEQRKSLASIRDELDLRSASTSALIYQVLWNDIVSLRRYPGDPILEKEIAAQFGVSRTPVREAILRLSNEKLIEILPQSGTFVARIALDTLPEAIVVRKALEDVTVRAAALKASRTQIATLRANLELQKVQAAEADYEGFRRTDDTFHTLIAEAAGYPGIWDIIKSVKIKVDRYCHLSLPKPGRIARLIKEHTAIFNAIRDHDPDRAAEAIHAHLDAIMTGVEMPENLAVFTVTR
ncbi:GntR family transcriptional regulator [Rhizobium wenxiniae]|uniref:DNA-binding GntR family transcriptional regulator n=1 Tax=Rhizobium wenxiniae TaxID=1737357 RepID=A0A7X0D212_9HYPH|nr:GntR family transcriptional regulator [Rhizobium wenxiniae]MBB6165012.1 DNA-binding GntR family transcriptional regulator [Rhizobium wenxiniae]GGG10348.1 GntR family transcriptional regulator [Rhizobium wenxiniae]